MNDRDRAPAERIALLLDGKLSPGDRAGVLEEIGRSEEESAVLAEAAAILRELEAEEGGGSGSIRVGPASGGPRRGMRPIVSWLAAAAVLVVAGGWWWRVREPGGDGEVLRARVVLALAEPPPVGGATYADPSAVPLFGVTRAATPALSPAARATRLGVAMADLQVRVARRAPAAEEAARRASALLADIPGSGPVAALFDEVRRGAGGPPEALDEPLRAARAAAAAATDSTRVALAEWAQLARYAAVRRDGEFLNGAYTRRTVDHARASLPAGDPTLAAVGTLAEVPAPTSAADWVAFGRRAEDLLLELEGGGAAR